MEEIEDLVWVPGEAELIQAIRRSQHPFPEPGIRFLTKIVGSDAANKTIDLSQLFLSSKQIMLWCPIQDHRSFGIVS